jgi:hypothetical protein
MVSGHIGAMVTTQRTLGGRQVPKYAKTIEGKRRYRNPNRHNDEYIYRSVTSVTGALPKEALLYWYARSTAQEAVDQLVQWGAKPAYEAIEQLYKLLSAPVDETIDYLKGAPTRQRDTGADRGTTVHAVIDNILQGKSYEVEALVEPWVAAAIKFVQEARPRVERSETTTYDERTLCAGTFDFLGRLDSAPELGRVLIDWKTSKGVYLDQAVQLVGGYLYGSEYILDDDGKELEWREPDTALIVHLTPDGYAIRPVAKDRTLRRAFLGALEIRKWEEGGQPIGEPYQLQLNLDGPSFDRMPTDSELSELRSRLRLLTTEKQLAISNHAREISIETNMKRMTVDDFDRLKGLLSLYEMGEPVAEQQSQPTQSRRPMRPMP